MAKKSMEDTNGKREPGKIIKLTPEAKVTKVGSETSSKGFAAGGAAKKEGGKVEGEKEMPNFAKRARGGSVFSAAGSMSGRSGKSDSGHEGE